MKILVSLCSWLDVALSGNNDGDLVRGVVSWIELLFSDGRIAMSMSVNAVKLEIRYQY